MMFRCCLSTQPVYRKEWNSVITPSESLRNIGSGWLKSRTSAVLRVPAVTIRGEFNYLLNPEHKDFGRIVNGLPEPFVFDPRMWKRR